MKSCYPIRPLGEVLKLDLDEITVEAQGKYDIAGVYSFGRGMFARGPVSGVDTSYRSLNRLHMGRLVLSRLKAFEGAIAVVPQEFEGWFLSPEFPTFSFLPGEADPGYVKHLCRWPTFWELLATSSKGVGARRERVHPEKLLAIEVPMPEIEEQRRVVARIEEIGWHLDRVGDLDAAASRLSGALVPSLLATTAKRRPLCELVRRVRREEPVDARREYCLLGVRWYGEGLFVRERKPGSEVAATKLYRVESGDFVYNRLFAWKGSFAVAGRDVHGCHVSGEFPTFQVDHCELDARYLFALFSDPAVWTLVEDHSVGGTPTSRNRLKEAAFLEFEIPVPSLGDQAHLAGLVEQVQSTGRLRQRRATYLDGFRASVVNRAFAGLM